MHALDSMHYRGHVNSSSLGADYRESGSSMHVDYRGQVIMRACNYRDTGVSVR
jgi:hypothetical protein